MSHDQCPSTTKGEKRKASKAELAATPRTLRRVSGKPVWRSLDELADTPAFREELEREFPRGMSELVLREKMDLSAEIAGIAAAGAGGQVAKAGENESRRDFLKLMGASMALAGVAATVPGCRRPDHKIYTYSKAVPEDIIPGKPLYYVSSMPRFDGGSEGLLIETHEGRPTKIEGNPLHPMNRGKSTPWSLASILALYDPDRPKFPVFENPARGRIEASWDDFRAWAKDNLPADGEGVALLVDKVASPTRAAMIARLRTRWPKAKIFFYSPSESRGEAEGTKAALGAPMRAVLSISRESAGVIVSLDKDFLSKEPGELHNNRVFADTRRMMTTKDAMSRLYVVEPGLSVTGASADHRLRLSPSRVGAFAVALTRELLSQGGAAFASGLGAEVARAVEGVSVPGGADLDPVFVREVAADLLAHRGNCAVLAGGSQDAGVHALVVAINRGLDALNKGVTYLPYGDEYDGGQEASSVAALRELTGLMQSGAVSTLITVGTNPVYDAPGDLNFAEAYAKVPSRIALASYQTETANLATWSLNGSTYLESWGDTRSADGTIAPVQPMIAPLYDPSMSEIEFLALLGSEDIATAQVDGYELVRSVWRESVRTWTGASSAVAAAMDFEARWRRALHDGVLGGVKAPAGATTVNAGAVAALVAGVGSGFGPSSDALEVVFTVGHPGDGRYANLSWLQELPHEATKVVWDNPVLLSPRTAADLGLAPVGFRMAEAQEDLQNNLFAMNGVNGMYTAEQYPLAYVAELTLDGRKVEAPVWICPGVADNVAVLTLGYGRTGAGVVGDGVGVNFYPLRGSAWSSTSRATGLRIAKTPRREMIASTQNHWTLDGKDSVVRAVDLPAWRAHGDAVQTITDTFYSTSWDLNFAERLGELTHTPPNISPYENPFNRSGADPNPADVANKNRNLEHSSKAKPPAFTTRPQWGMTIDQGTCTGCGACIIACQSENNIPVVGKKEVAKGREMHWIRVDRYFVGNDFNHPDAVHHQPVTCVHCENAPCEVVCPVNATVHGPEGLNYMVYNRCIGTRYCANNCPYKVRRYNWFDYGVTKFNGGYFFQDVVEAVAPDRGGVTGSGTHNEINPNLIPPRLRQKLDEISRMQKNPDVTVRERGVMEKCTFCIQRINAARMECKLADVKDKDGNLVVPDGFFTTACAQACPTSAITFGDILDLTSNVHRTRSHARSFALLGYLNTRPRVSHMVRVMNPNPKILAVTDPARLAHIDNPFHAPGHGVSSGGDHSQEGGEHGPASGDVHTPPAGGNGHGGGAGGHSFRFDKSRRREDPGYALSLNVLGGGRA